MKRLIRCDRQHTRGPGRLTWKGAILSCCLTGALPHLASAGYLDLTLNNCVNESSLQDVNYTNCSTSTKYIVLYCTFSVPNPIPDFVGATLEFEFDQEIPFLDPFWHFEEGACNATGLSVNCTVEPGVGPCNSETNPWGSAGSQATLSTIYDTNNFRIGGRLLVVIGRTNPYPLIPGVRYYACTVIVNSSLGASCPGCGDKLAIQVHSAELTGLSGGSVVIGGSGLLGTCVRINGDTSCKPGLPFNDRDGDGYGDPESPRPQPYNCGGIQQPPCILDDTDCDDTNPEVHPGAQESCNGIDDDCDGQVDEEAVAQRIVPKAGSGLTDLFAAAMAWGDYDNDGDLDLVVSGYGGANATKLFRNGGGPNPTFTEVATSFHAVSDGSLAWGDYDRDGDLDLLLTGSAFSAVYRNNGGPNPTFTDIGAGLYGVGASSAQWGDMDNDGDLDIALSGANNTVRASKIYRNNGGPNPTFTEVVGALPVALTEAALAWGDYDNDGDLDLLLTGMTVPANPRYASIYRNSGGANPTFTDIGAGLVGVRRGAVAWGDYDHDGDLDILVAGHVGGTVDAATIYRNNGGPNPTFTDIGAGLAGASGSSAAWGDFDNDGDLDVAIAGYNGSANATKVYRNDGGTFVDLGLGLTGVADAALGWADYDGDGDLDLAVAGSTTYPNVGTPLTTLYRNDLCTLNTAPTAPTNLHIQSANGATTEFAWDAASDGQTPSSGLSYNLRIGTTPGGSEVWSAMAAADGKRKIAALGSTHMRRSWTVRLPGNGPYYWSVQAVDAGWVGSPFAAEKQIIAPVGVADGLPMEFALGASAPNPFSRATTFKYDLPRAERVRLEVFDLNGRRVRTLVSREVEAGRHQSVWDGMDERGHRVAAGVYVYRLAAGSFSAARRVALLP